MGGGDVFAATMAARSVASRAPRVPVFASHAPSAPPHTPASTGPPLIARPFTAGVGGHASITQARYRSARYADVSCTANAGAGGAGGGGVQDASSPPPAAAAAIASCCAQL